MRVFVTGATGFIGSAVVKELMEAGHEVLGLTRSEDGAKLLSAAGAAVYHGTIEDLENLRRGVAMCDGVIHTAFIHDFSKFKENCEKDRLAIAAMGEVLVGTGKPIIVTSGTGFGIAVPGSLATEDYVSPGGATTHPRIASEEAAAALVAQGVQISVMRLPPSVHGDGDHGFVPALIGIARAQGVSAYIGEGLNRWPAVHRLDAAKAYRLALEHGAVALRYHAVGEEGMPCRDIAEVIGRHLSVPVVSKSAEEAGAHFGFLGGFFAADVPASGKLTQDRLGWQPTHAGLIADLEHGTYFK